MFVGEDRVGLWWVSGGDHGRSVVTFFGGMGYFREGFFGSVVQVVGFVWHGSNGLWFGDCCSVWWKSAWSCGGYGKSAWSCVCGSVVGSDGCSVSGFAFGLMIRLWCWDIWGVTMCSLCCYGFLGVREK